MFTLKTTGINEVIKALNELSESIITESDNAMEYSRDLVVKRVESGRDSEGTIMRTRSSKSYFRYSDIYGRKEANNPRVFSLNKTGNLHSKFNRKIKSRGKNRYTTSITFRGESYVDRSRGGKTKSITYLGLARVHEERWGGSIYALSEQEKAKVLKRFLSRIKKI